MISSVHATIHNLTGATLLGHIVSVALYGVTCLQAYLYFSEYSESDHSLLRLFVGILVSLDSAHVCLVTHTIYWYTIIHFGDLEALSTIVWSLEAQVGVAYFIAFCIQLFFAWRVYIVSRRKNYWAPGIIIIASLSMLASSIGFMIFGLREHHFSQSHTDIPWTIAGLSSELISDVTITSTLVYYFMKGHSSIYQSTRKIFASLIFNALNTCALTTVLTLLDLILFLLFTETLLYIPFFFVLVRIYLCSFLSTLNNRATLHGSNTYKVPTSGRECDSIALPNIQSRHRRRSLSYPGGEAVQTQPTSNLYFVKTDYSLNEQQ